MSCSVLFLSSSRWQVDGCIHYSAILPSKNWHFRLQSDAQLNYMRCFPPSTPSSKHWITPQIDWVAGPFFANTALARVTWQSWSRTWWFQFQSPLEEMKHLWCEHFFSRFAESWGVQVVRYRHCTKTLLCLCGVVQKSRSFAIFRPFRVFQAHFIHIYIENETGHKKMT